MTHTEEMIMLVEVMLLGCDREPGLGGRCFEMFT
jgi:hypothetical protein